MNSTTIPGHYKTARLHKASRSQVLFSGLGAVLLVLGFPATLAAMLLQPSTAVLWLMFGSLILGIASMAVVLLTPYQCIACNGRLRRSVISEQQGAQKLRGFLYICESCQSYEKELYGWIDD